MVVIRSAPWHDLDAVTAYEVARLRQDVFVVEQSCVYADLDGRDLEPGAVQVWAEDGVGAVVGCLRVLREAGGGVRIGRVATARGARGEGVATALVRSALEDASRPVVLDAQSHLEHWYSRLGFVRDGEEFAEDGIPHVPMRLSR